jgi:hypothetical protein
MLGRYRGLWIILVFSYSFYDFPQKLPENTTTLFITNNQITSLNMLCTRNSSYNGIYDLYLDYNLISDVSVLENCEWWEIWETWNIVNYCCFGAWLKIEMRHWNCSNLFLCTRTCDCAQFCMEVLLRSTISGGGGRIQREWKKFNWSKQVDNLKTQVWDHKFDFFFHQ